VRLFIVLFFLLLPLLLISLAVASIAAVVAKPCLRVCMCVCVRARVCLCSRCQSSGDSRAAACIWLQTLCADDGRQAVVDHAGAGGESNEFLRRRLYVDSVKHAVVPRRSVWDSPPPATRRITAHASSRREDNAAPAAAPSGQPEN